MRKSVLDAVYFPCRQLECPHDRWGRRSSRPSDERNLISGHKDVDEPFGLIYNGPIRKSKDKTRNSGK